MIYVDWFGPARIKIFCMTAVTRRSVILLDLPQVDTKIKLLCVAYNLAISPGGKRAIKSTGRRVKYGQFARNFVWKIGGGGEGGVASPWYLS